MINVSVFFNGLNTREELLSFAQKLYAEKKLVKYIIYEKEKCSDEMSIENFINNEFTKHNHSHILLGCVLGIETKSRKTLQLLNEFVKRNHYNKYAIWHSYRGCGYKLRMTLDELLNEYPK